MVKRMMSDAERLLIKITALKEKITTETSISDMGGNEVINNVALSNDIAAELKEILIVLHTTMTTESMQSKVSSYRVNIEIIEVFEDIVQLQSSIINKLSITTEPTSSKPLNKTWGFFKVYKTPISIMIVIATIWLLTVIDSVAMKSVYDNIPTIIKGVKGG